MNRIGIAWLILLLATGCATEEKKQASPPSQPVAPGLDFRAVQHDLGMDIPPGWVGFREKQFDACRMAADLPTVPDCSRAYFIQVGFQLSCRPTEDASNGFLAQSDMTPVANRDLHWRLGRESGRVRTDSTGSGVILAISSGSMQYQRLRVSTGDDFLVMPAREATSIVTPVSWCR